MKATLLIAGVITAITLIVYPAMEHYADLERGYDSCVIGGEEMFLFFGIFAAVLVILDGLCKEKNSRDNATAPTESEERN
jgi:hypothetical protein